MEKVTLQLTAMAHGGRALGRHEGRVIFVSYALPGETVLAEITEDKGRYAFARPVELLEPAPERIEPPCPYFGPTGCGGCQWQHISYEAQLRLKAEIVADQLTRIGSVADPSVRPTLPDRTGWAYRNHAQFRPASDGGLGFQAASPTRRHGREEHTGTGPRASLPANGSRASLPANGPRAPLPANAPQASLPANGPRAPLPANAPQASPPANGPRASLPANGPQASPPANGPRASLPANAVKADSTPGAAPAPGQDVISIDECLILHPLLSDLYAMLDLDLPDLERLSLRAGTETGDLMLIFEMMDDLPPALEIDLPVSCVLLLSDGQHANLIGDNHITELVAGHAYRISAPSFFQVNTPQAAHLIEQVLAYLDLKGDETVLDAYCGVGLFTVPLAQRAGLVVGVESAPAAVADLLENTAALDNVEVIEGLVEDVLPDLDFPLDAAVVDPPRAGVDRFALDALAAHRPARLVYVSCDPATLARDAKRLVRAGYHLVEVQPVDMFPQTYHVESVALFETQETA